MALPAYLNMSENPLLSISFEIPFDRIEVAHVEPGIQELIRQSQRNIDDIVGSKQAANRQKDKESLPRLLSFREWLKRNQ